MKKCHTLVVLLILIKLLLPAAGDPRCSKIVLHAWCSAETTRGMVHALSSCDRDHVVPMFERRCRLNEQGHYCGSFMDYIADIQAANYECLDQEEMGECSESCSKKLELLREELGCCINEMLNGTRRWLYKPLFDHTLWEDCNVTTAAPSCLPSPLARAMTTENANCTRDEVFNKTNYASCKRSVLQPLLDKYESHGCAKVGEDQMNTCGVDEHGQWCIKRLVSKFRTIRLLTRSAAIHCPRMDKCSRDCKLSLQAIREVMGCCLSNSLNNTFVELVYAETYEYFRNYTSHALWSLCGVPHPGYCNVVLHDAGIPAATYLSLNAVLLIAAVVFSTQYFH